MNSKKYEMRIYENKLSTYFYRETHRSHWDALDSMYKAIEILKKSGNGNTAEIRLIDPYGETIDKILVRDWKGLN